MLETGLACDDDSDAIGSVHPGTKSPVHVRKKCLFSTFVNEAQNMHLHYFYFHRFLFFKTKCFRLNFLREYIFTFHLVVKFSPKIPTFYDEAFIRGYCRFTYLSLKVASLL